MVFEKDKKTEFVAVRYSKAEMKLVTQAAKNSDRKLADWIRITTVQQASRPAENA